jgi:hypothetical protein
MVLTMSDRELLIRIDERVAAIEHHLRGNGQPGVCMIEANRIQSLERWRAKTIGAMKVWGWTVGTVATVDSAAAAVLKFIK